MKLIERNARRGGSWVGLVLLMGLSACTRSQSSTPRNAAGLRELVLKMRVDDWRERRRSGDALRALGSRSVPELVEILHAQDSTLDKLVGGIGEEFTTPSFYWHGCAASALGEIGPEASAAVLDLAAAQNETPAGVSIQHRDFVSSRARAALIKIRREPLAQLDATLADPSSPEWAAALATAEELGDYGRPLLATLIQLLDDRASAKRASIVNAISRIDGAGVASYEALIRALYDDDDSVRWFALRALRHAGSRSNVAREAVAALLADPVRSVRQQAIETLAAGAAEQDRPACTRLIEPLLRDPAEEVRETARLRIDDLAR